MSERIKRITAPLGVKTIFRSDNTLRQSLINVKNQTPREARKGVVYEVPHADCSHVYIGDRTDPEEENERKLLCSEQIQVKQWNSSTKYMWENEHRVNWEAAKVRLVEHNCKKRRVLEAIIIKKEKLTSHLDCGL